MQPDDSAFRACHLLPCCHSASADSAGGMHRVCLRFLREICFLAVCCIAKVCPSTKLQVMKPDVGEWSVSVVFLPLYCWDGPSGTQWIGGWLKTVPASDVMPLFSQYRITSCAVCV